MQVDGFSTFRRYPQIMISDQSAPVQWNMKKGNTLIVETFEAWPNTYEFQVCNKCHGFREPATPGITRVEATRIVSTKIDPSNRSFHPIATTGRNAQMSGLMLGYTTSSMIGCTDCHNNNEWTIATGNAPRGPHASRFAPILERNYMTADGTPESPSNYDLCYKCHDRNSILGDVTFPHKVHLVDQQTPCSICHDSHAKRIPPQLSASSSAIVPVTIRAAPRKSRS